MTQLMPLPHAKASLIRKLMRDKKVRDAEGAFILEGEKPVHELLPTRAAFRMIVMSATYLKHAERGILKTLNETPRHGPAVAVHVCPDEFFARLTDVRTAQGLLAVLEKPRWEATAVLTKAPLLGVYGEQLQDPTNVGTLIRTAAAFNVDGLWLTPDSADPFNPKVVRASAGAVMHVPIFVVPDVSPLLNQGCALLAAQSERGGKDLREITRLPAKTILALGNESRGLSAATVNKAVTTFHISTQTTVESLNVATAAAVALFHLTGLPRR